MGTGLDAAMKQASCSAENGLSTQLQTTWSSSTALHPSTYWDAHAEAPDDPLFEPAALTVSAWVLGTDWLGCGGIPEEPMECSVVAKGNTDEGNGYWLLISGGQPRFTLAGDGSAEHDVFFGSRLETNVWYHVVATFDGTTGTIYVNGVQGESSTVDFPVTHGDEGFLIGGMVNRNFNLIGYIDEVMLWDCAKSATQVAALYDSYLAR